MKKKVLLISLTSLLVFSLAGCRKKGQEEETEYKPEVVAGHYIVENNLSSYYVVTSKNPQVKEVNAAEEFSYFMNEATKCYIPTITEKEVKKSYNYISLGVTTQFKNAYPNFDFSQVDGTQSTYFIGTKDDNIYIVASDDFRGYGVLYGVYDLLHDLVGYTYYHDSEIYVEEKDTVNLLKYADRIVKPSFDHRSISTLYTMSHDIHTQRLRLLNNSRGGEWCRKTYGHGQINKFLAPWDLDENGVRYGDSHPDWFINPGQEDPQIKDGMIANGWDWSAGKDMRHVVAQKMIQFVRDDPDAIFFMCAQEDNNTICTSERNKKALAEYGGSQCGLQIDFMNDVIKEVEEWIDANQPGREIQYLIFAYQTTLQPPVKKDSNGNTVPYSDRVVPHEKLRIYIAPIEANYAFTFSSPVNADFGRILKDWGAIANGQIVMYLYDLNYRIYFVNFNNFGTVAGMYKECQDIGASYMLTQGVSDSNICCFDEMRSYVESNLMWNLKLNYDELAYDFMDHFYKDAAPYMKDIYNTIRDRYAYYQALVKQSSGHISGDIRSSDLYPFALVRQLNIDIDNALESIAHLKSEDYSLFETLKNRIMKEYLSVIYLKIILYRSNFSEEEINEMLDTFNFYTQLFGITKSGEGVDIFNIFD